MSNTLKPINQPVGGGSLKISSTLKHTKMSKIIERIWPLIILVLGLGIASQFITTFWITGWQGIILGVVVVLITFFIGIYATKTVITKETNIS